MKRKVFLAAILVFMASTASAIDINSTTSLRYFPDSNMEFRVDTSGNALFKGEVNISGSNGQIASFESNQITMNQPLSIESSGPLSVENGIDLTGTSTNTIDSYSSLYLKTSSGSPTDIVLDPTGVTDIDSNLTVRGDTDLSDNNLKNVNTLKLKRGIDYDPTVDSNFYIYDKNAKSRSLEIDNNQNVQIPNGNLKMSGGDINFSSKSTKTGAVLGGGSETSVEYANGLKVRTIGQTVDFKVGSGGSVYIPNGNLDMGNNDIIDTNSFYLDSNSVTSFWDGTPSSPSGRLLKIYDSGNVEIPNGNLDMNDNRIVEPSKIGESTRYSAMDSAFHDSFEDNSLNNWARVDTSTGGGATGIGTGGQVGANPIGDYLINMEGSDIIEYQSNISLSSLDDPVLTFYWACRSCDNAGGHVEVSADGGSSWTQINTLKPQENSGSGNSNLQYEVVDLSSYGGQGDIRIRFEGSPGGGDDFAVDNINIRGERGFAVKSSKTQVASRSTLVAESPVQFDAGLRDKDNAACGSNQFINGNGNCETDKDTDTNTQDEDENNEDQSLSIGSDSLSINDGSGNNVNSVTVDDSPDTIADDGTIQEGEIGQNSLDDSEVADNSLNEVSIAGNSVGASELIDNSVEDSELQDNVVDNSEIQNGDGFTVGGITSNGNLLMKGNEIRNGAISLWGLGPTSGTSIVGNLNNYFIGADHKFDVTASPSCNVGEIFDNSWSSNCRFTDSDLPASINIDFEPGGSDPTNPSNDFERLVLYFPYGRYVSDVTLKREYSGGDSNCGDGDETIETIFSSTSFSSSKKIINVPGDGQTCEYTLELSGSSNYADDIRVGSIAMYTEGDRTQSGGFVKKSGDKIYGNLDMNGNTLQNVNLESQSVNEGEINQNQLDDSELAGNFIDDSEVADNSLTEVSIAGNSVGASELIDNSVEDSELQNNVVDNSEIQNSDRFTFNSKTLMDVGSNNDAILELRKTVDSPKEYGLVMAMDGDGTDDVPLDIRTSSVGTSVGPSDTQFFVDGTGDLAINKDYNISQGVPYQLQVAGSAQIYSLVGQSSGSQCGSNEFVNGNGNCKTDTDTDTDDQNLQDVLVQGNATGGRDIDLDGGELVDSSGRITLGGSTVEVTDGKLDLSGNNLTGFFDSACGENEAVTDVYNNGTFNCGQAGGGLPSVLDINNSANQDIDLYGNNITDSTGGNITFNQSLKVYGDLWLEGSASGGGGGSQNLSEVLENGNSTLGRGIDMDGGNITDIGGLQDCGQDEFVNGNGSCEVDTNTDTDNQNLQDVLVQGNATGGRDIDLDGGNLTDSTASNVTIGKSLKVYGNIWAPEGAGLGGSQNLSEVLSNGNSTGGTDIDLDGANITDSTKGNVSVDDDLFVYGDIYGTGADLAEIYSSPQELEKGDVVAINTRKEDSVVRSSERYQETVAGVVSTNPGQTLNWNEDGYPIALAGKVPVKVTEENGEIEIGDRLVPSSTSGTAMKCETWDPLERKNKSLRRIVSHNQDCRNSAIGKALESSTGRGKILVKLE
ncbi:MAG: hypothetical protein ABEJ03_04190 [Candidatus Nanohaloarchaea archaeon]